MDKDEFNERVNELVGVSESRVIDEFSNLNEFENIPESSESLKAKKAKKIKDASIAFVTLIAGGSLTVGATVSSPNLNKTELTIVDIGTNSAFFEFKSEYQNLTVRFYNDFESVDGFIQYNFAASGQIEGLYDGTCGCQGLKSFTKYTVVLEGDKVLGNATKAKLKFTTLKEANYL